MIQKHTLPHTVSQTHTLASNENSNTSETDKLFGNVQAIGEN